MGLKNQNVFGECVVFFARTVKLLRIPRYYHMTYIHSVWVCKRATSIPTGYTGKNKTTVGSIMYYNNSYINIIRS